MSEVLLSTSENESHSWHLTGLLKIDGLAFWWNSCSIFRAGRRALKTERVSLPKMQDPGCSSLGRHTKASRFLQGLQSSAPGFFFQRGWSMSWQKGSVKILWKNILESRGSLAAGVTIQISGPLATTATLLELKGQSPARVGTLEAERTQKKPGLMWPMKSYHVEKSKELFSVFIVSRGIF